MTKPKNQMLINYVPGEECRIAIARDGRLEEFYQERASTESHVGNIYKGRVTNIESSIQAAFIDFGLERNGFLHISDLHPMCFPGKDREEFERVGSKTPHRRRPPIQNCLKKGQEILVQVLKEGIGTKGPTLTTYLSIPGRFLVMMPNMQRLGVSRRVDDDDSRHASRKLLAELDPPEGFGFIVRTAGIGQTKTDLKRDLAYLQRLWKNIEQRRKSIGRVGELYTESDLIIRTIRDVFSNDIDRVVVDDPTAARRAHDFLAVASPRAQSKVVFYNDPVPLFDRFGIETQIERIHDREAPLPSGGSLVIDATEALVAIDVNSGKSRDARDAESNAFNTNKEAVEEIARQLRLRDLGGVIVNDLIDMRDPKHRKQIESLMRQALKNDRARTRVGSISQFGLLEMTRQRMRPSLRTSNYNTCQSCEGFGYAKSPESVVLDVMRRLRLVMQHQNIVRIELTISPDVAFQLLNRKRGELVQLEHQHQKSVMVRVGGHRIDYLDLAAYDDRGLVDLETLSEPKRLPAEKEAAYVELKQGELPPEVKAELEQARRDEAALTDQPDPLKALEQGEASEAVATDDELAVSAAAGEDQPQSRKSRRRRRGGRGRRKKTQETQESQETRETQESQQPSGAEFPQQQDTDSQGNAVPPCNETAPERAAPTDTSPAVASHSDTGSPDAAESQIDEAEAGEDVSAQRTKKKKTRKTKAKTASRKKKTTKKKSAITTAAAPATTNEVQSQRQPPPQEIAESAATADSSDNGEGPSPDHTPDHARDHKPATTDHHPSAGESHATTESAAADGQAAEPAGDGQGNGTDTANNATRRKGRRRGGRRRSSRQPSVPSSSPETVGEEINTTAQVKDAVPSTASNSGGGYTNRLLHVQPRRAGESADDPGESNQQEK